MGEVVLEILKEYQGIIGTLIGIIITTVLNRIIKTRGKITIYKNNFNLKKSVYPDNSYCNDEILKYFYYEYTFNLQIYNSSEEIRFIRDLKINIYINIYDKKNKEPIESQPQYYDKSKGYGNFENINAVNLKPKEIRDIEVIGTFLWLRSENELYSDLEKIVLTYRDDKNKHKEIVIKDYIKTS